MKAKIGLYYVARHKESWGIFQYTNITENSTYSDHVEDYPYFEEAIKKSFNLNGWKEPNTIIKR